jgi:hypothetical protein
MAKSYKKLDQQLESVLEEAEKVSYNPEKFNDDVRKQIAKFFVEAYFVLLLFTFFGSLVFNISIYKLTGSSDLFIPVKDIILLISSVIGGSLGFIVGYYFKSDSNKN